MGTNKLTINDKIDEFNELIERREKIKSLVYYSGEYPIEVSIRFEKHTLAKKDEELQDFICNYYKKELEEVDKRLNEFFK